MLLGPAGWGPQLDLAGLAEGQVVTTGCRNDDEVRRIVAGAAVLAFPSAAEGFGLPPLEAFAAGVPVVASDLPVTREVLGNDPARATLVPPGRRRGARRRTRRPSDPPRSARGRGRATGLGRPLHLVGTAAATVTAYERALALTARAQGTVTFRQPSNGLVVPWPTLIA